jgi:hypothetical protein
MTNLRRRLGKALGHEVPDELWNVLVDEDLVMLAEREEDPVGFLRDQLRLSKRVVRSLEGRSEAPIELDRPRDAALAARADALAAIHRAWAEHDTKVTFFRNRALPRMDPHAWAEFATRHGPHPGYALLTEADLDAWIQKRFHDASATGDGTDHLNELLAATQRGQVTPLVHLHYAVGDEIKIQTVSKRGILGDLAALAERLADEHRWQPAHAATFVLTGTAPPVEPYTVSGRLRYGTGAAMSRVTLDLDPAMTPRQVSALYTALRAYMRPDQPRRSLSIKHYRLAEYVGPHLRLSVDNPGNVVRRGRPRRGHPVTGLARYVDVVGESVSWASLCRGWNERFGERGQDGRPWRYAHLSNFTRDAQQAVQQLLDPGWRWPKDRAGTS